MQAPIKQLSPVQKIGKGIIDTIEFVEDVPKAIGRGYEKMNVFFGIEGEDASDARLFYYGCMVAMTVPALYIVAAL